MRRTIAAVVVGAAAVVAVVLWQLGIILPRGGPMDGIGAQAGFRAEAGSEVAAAFHLPNERLESVVEIRSIEPVVSPHLEVTDVAIGRCPDFGSACTSLSYRRWPPRNMVLEEPEDYELARNDHALVLVRVRVPEGGIGVHIRGVRIDYADGWRRYRAEVGPIMVINPRA